MADSGERVERLKTNSLQALRDAEFSGLLIRGAAGVGKSELAKQVLDRLSDEGRIVMSVARHTSPDKILAEIGRQLFAKAVEFGLPEDDPNRQLAVAIRRPDVEWPERFQRLSSRFFSDMPLVFLLDDFDDNLRETETGHEAGHEVASADLAEFLGAWIESPGKTRLLIASRHPFRLPDDSHQRLADLDVGAPNLDVDRPVVRRAVSPETLQQLGDLERRLLVGASVYRVPVDDLALLWQVADERAQDLELAERVRIFHEKIQTAQQEGKNPTPSELGMTDKEFVDALSDMEAWMQPPLDVPKGFPEARDELSRLGLLEAVHSDERSTFWAVHRTTADSLAELVGEAVLQEAHGRAARFWRFRVQRATEDPAEALEQQLEARSHYRVAGEMKEAVRLTEQVCDQLESWGANRRIEELCREVLDWIPDSSEPRASFLLQLGLAQESRGFLGEARCAYQEALAISEELDHRPALAGSCHHLGRVAQAQGDLQGAVDWYRKSLALSEELQLPAGMASTICQLGALETESGSPEAGMGLNLQSLAIRLELGSAEAAADLHWLHRQREDLGSDRFAELLEEHAGPDGARNILELLGHLETTVAAEF